VLFFLVNLVLWYFLRLSEEKREVKCVYSVGKLVGFSDEILEESWKVFTVIRTIVILSRQLQVDCSITTFCLPHIQVHLAYCSLN
jgi:hypothetical protein